MGGIERTPTTGGIFSNWQADQLINGAAYLLFSLYLTGVLVSHATGNVHPWQIATGYVLLGVGLLGWRQLVDGDETTGRLQIAFLTVVGLAFLLMAILYQSRADALGLGPSRPLEILVVFLAIAAFFITCGAAERYSSLEWAAVGCFLVIVGVFLYHTLAAYPTSARSRWPIWAAVIMGGNLLLIPRLVPERVFLWLMSWLSAVTVVLGLLTYAIGEYSLWFLEVQQWHGSPSVPGLELEVNTMQSFFVNPNALGLVAFAGLTGAAIELHRTFRDGYVGLAAMFGVLAVLNGVGVFLSNARAAMLASVICLGIYAAYAVVGRAAVPVAVVTLLAGLGAFLLTVYFELIGIDVSNRFDLWWASVQAFRDGPMLLGAGTVDPALLIESYMPGDRTWSPHNSYLSIFLRGGLVAGLAYVALVVGSTVVGTIRYREVNVGMLAFAIGWAVHQLFEAYTLFQWSIGSVLATLAVGYLLFGRE